MILSSIGRTVPGFELKALKDYYLSREEVILILILLTCLKGQGRMDEYSLSLQELLDYIETHYTDEEEKVKIFPKAALFLAELKSEQGSYIEAADICRKAIGP